MTVTRDLRDEEKEALLADDGIPCQNPECERTTLLAELIAGARCPACDHWHEFSLYYGSETELPPDYEFSDID